MPGQPFRIDEGPEKPESEAQKGNTRQQEAPDRRGQVDRSARPGDEFDPPGHHSQGLAASHPESDKKTGRDAEQEALEPDRAGRDCVTASERQDGKPGQHPQSSIQEQVV